jgi:hypothetical protein
VANTGDDSLAVSSVKLVGGDADQFAISGETCTDGRVRPGESCSISVRLRPITEGPATATLRIADNAADSPQSVALSGAGGIPPTPKFSASPSSVAFPSQRVGTSSASRRIDITNTGTAPLAIGSTAVAGAHPGDFTIAADTCGGETVAAGAGCHVDVRFRPFAPGARVAALVLDDSATGGPHAVPLSGHGCVVLTGPICF